MSKVSGFMNSLWNEFKTAEELALLKPLATAMNNYAINPTAINFMAQMGMALMELQAAQPMILQSELQQISAVLQQAASAVAAEQPKA